MDVAEKCEEMVVNANASVGEGDHAAAAVVVVVAVAFVANGREGGLPIGCFDHCEPSAGAIGPSWPAY